jgi:DNA-binding response OmpR family regulator
MSAQADNLLIEMLHILLVEDNPADVLMAREGIRKSSISADVTVAYDGEQAIRILTDQSFKPDFIILDLNLPKFSGFTLLERYRTEEGPPVVVLSGSDRESDRQRALELGAQQYVVKPLGFDAFVDTVTGIVERWVKPLHKEIAASQ